MTVAKYNDYVAEFDPGMVRFYENKHPIPRCFFAHAFLKSNEGREVVKVQFLQCLKEKLSFTVPVSSVMGIAAAFFTGNVGFIPTCIFSGFFYGSIKAIPNTIVEVEYCNEYKLWKGRLVEDKISDIFQNFLLEDEVLKDLTCPFLGDLPKIPVKSRNGKVTYEQEKILENIKRKVPGKISGHYEDPSEDDLIFDKSDS